MNNGITNGMTNGNGMDKSMMNAPDAIDLLKADHQKVSKLFKEFQRLEKKDDQSGRIGEIVEEVCNELKIHTTIEEEIFYAGVRGKIDDDLLDEAEVEHTSAKELIAQLDSMSEGDRLYNAKFTVLCEYIEHHVEEEETEMFPKVKKAKIDTKALGAELFARKQALQEEMGLPVTPPPRAPRKALAKTAATKASAKKVAAKKVAAKKVAAKKSSGKTGASARR